jgi:peroxiredoxin
VVFTPLEWSPGSSRQLDLLQQEVAGFDAREARPVGISVDSVFSHRAWAAARGITFPLLADFHPKGEVTRRYGVWREADGFSERALYVLDAESRITHAHVSPFLHRLPAIDDVLAALDGARVETAGWEPAVVEELTG